MGSSQEAIECWGTFDFRISNVDDAGYVSTLDTIRARYQPFQDDIRFREVLPVEEGYVKTTEDYFRLVFVSNGGEISGLYDRNGVYMFGVRVDNRGTPQPFEILDDFKFSLPEVYFKRVACGVDYKSLGDPGAASYTMGDLANAVNILLGGFKKAGIRWGPAMTTLIGATSEALKSIAMERHVVVGLNIITKGVQHTPSKRIVKIMKSWSKISKSIKTGKYDYEMNYVNENGIEIIEKVTRYSAGQILALTNYKDGSQEEKQIRKQGKEETRKRKRDDFEERGEGSNKGNLKNLKAQKKSEAGSGSGSRSAESEDDISDFHYYKAPEVFNVHMTPHGVYTSSDSDLDSEAEDDKTPEDEKTPADDKAPELFNPHMTPHGVYTSSDSDSEAEDDKTPEDEKTPADDKAPELFNPHMTPHGVYTSSDSDSEAEDDKTPEDEKTPADDTAPELFNPHMTPHGVYTSSDSDSEAEDDKTPEDEKTPADDKAPELFNPHMTPHGVYTSSDSDSEAEDDKTPVSEDEKTPTPVFLVKHGTKRPAEAGGCDKGFKRAEEEEMASEGAEKNPTDDPNAGGRSLIV